MSRHGPPRKPQATQCTQGDIFKLKIWKLALGVLLTHEVESRVLTDPRAGIFTKRANYQTAVAVLAARRTHSDFIIRQRLLGPRIYGLLSYLYLVCLYIRPMVWYFTCLCSYYITVSGWWTSMATDFYRATCMHSADYMPWQDVCLSICLSHAGIESKRL